ncbi:MAG: DUF1801 domain-containing protein [Bdellovibrionales bacterium]|nr:DUF1801 domain-containing protein [Bdellovibrionales bacterium]
MATVYDIDTYIEQEAPLAKRYLKAVRTLIRKTVPKATEKIAWGMPTFYLEGNLIHFAAFKNHISLFPGSDAVAKFKKEWAKHGDISKGTMQLPYQNALPQALVRKIVKFCVSRNLSKKDRSRKVVQRPKRARHPMPAFVRSALLRMDLMEAYHARPPYQQNDYVGWIGQAAREETKQKRLSQMLRELRAGNLYMNMPYRKSVR